MAKVKFEKVTVDGIDIINTTPHSITFGVKKGDDIEAVEVPPCGTLINAKAISKTVKIEKEVEFVTTVFEGTPEGETLINKIKEEYPEGVVVGSIIAAQAYPEQVVGMVPLPGFERVAPPEKRMDPHKFTIFTK